MRTIKHECPYSGPTNIEQHKATVAGWLKCPSCGREFKIRNRQRVMQVIPRHQRGDRCPALEKLFRF